MDTPIISPVFFYFLQLMDRLEVVEIVALVLSIVAVVTLFIVALCVCDCNYNYSSFEEFLKDHQVYPKWIKRSSIIVIISTLMLVFIPSTKTIISMAVAKNVTPQTLEVAKDTVKSGVDYVFEKIDTMKNKNTESNESQKPENTQ